MSDLTQQHVQSLFEYKDGQLFWKEKHSRGRVNAGDKAGCLTSRGYHRVMIGYKEYPSHRIIYLYHHGFMPKVVDHIDGNPLNNNIDNLRAADYQTNQYNRKKGLNNTSGCKNVSWNARSKKWQIHIRHNKKVKCWYVDNLELAELVAQEARSKFHGEYVNHG